MINRVIPKLQLVADLLCFLVFNLQRLQSYGHTINNNKLRKTFCAAKCVTAVVYALHKHAGDIVVKLCVHFVSECQKRGQTDTKVTLHSPTGKLFFQMKGMAKIRLIYSGDMALILSW